MLHGSCIVSKHEQILTSQIRVERGAKLERQGVERRNRAGSHPFLCTSRGTVRQARAYHTYVSSSTSFNSPSCDQQSWSSVTPSCSRDSEA